MRAVFRDELGKMLPHDDDASRLARSAYHFGEFCTAFGIEPPPLAANCGVADRTQTRLIEGSVPRPGRRFSSATALAALPRNGPEPGQLGHAVPNRLS